MLTNLMVVYITNVSFLPHIGPFANVNRFHEQTLPIFTGLMNGLCQSLPLFCTLPIFTACQTLPVVRYKYSFHLKLDVRSSKDCSC
jgi:hypothetical protein